MLTKFAYTRKSVSEDCLFIKIYKLFYTLASKGEAEKQLGLSRSVRRVKAIKPKLIMS